MKTDYWVAIDFYQHKHTGVVTMHKFGTKPMDAVFLGTQQLSFPSELEEHEKRASITVDDLIEAYAAAFGKGSDADPVHERMAFIIMKKELFGV